MSRRRYARLEQVELIGEALARLQTTAVAVIGLGNTGGQVAAHFAMMGVGLVLVDHDVVSEENLASQGFSARDVGRPKVEARARALRRLNPSCRIESLHADVARLGMGALRQVPLICACVDSAWARAEINELAARLGTPWLDCAVDGSGTTCLSRVAAYHVTPESPCFLCSFDRSGLRRLTPGAREGCPRWRPEQPVPVPAPTVAMSAVGGAVAAAQVIWSLRVLVGRGTELFGREIYLDLDAGHLTSHALRRNPDCVFDHRRFELTPTGRSVTRTTVAETFAAADAALGGRSTLRLHRGSLATELRCAGCQRVKHPFRLLETLSPRAARCRCGQVMQPVAGALLECVAEDDASGFLDRTWAEVGLPDRDVVTAVRGDGEIHFLFD